MIQTGIIVALPEELRTVTRQRLTLGETATLDSGALVALSGSGPKQAAAASQQLVDQGATGLISWGCAAGLDPSLRPGALLLPQQILTVEDQLFAVDRAWHDQLAVTLAWLQPHHGTVVESHQLVATAAEKQALFNRSQSEPLAVRADQSNSTGPITAVDMESGSIAKVAAENGIPFVAIRTVADPAESNLPNAVVTALEPTGRVNMIKLFRHLLRQPGEIGGLIALGRHFSAAQKNLRCVARTIATVQYCQEQATRDA